jgi:hypothetical protein
MKEFISIKLGTIVIVPLIEINDMIGRVILKVISPEFLIKHGE